MLIKIIRLPVVKFLGVESVKKLKGMHDIFYPEVEYFREIERTAEKLFRQSGFEEIRTPVLEETTIFTRSVGEDTDIVSKEMYHFRDQGGKDVCLRPENTASIVRAFLENRFSEVFPAGKFYYYGPMFRRERPQKGRYRQFYQIGVEIIGRADASADSEILKLLQSFFKEVGLRDLFTEINSIGCSSCRPAYRSILKDYLASIKGLCDDCRRRRETNPLRVLDCKQLSCGPAIKGAPCPADFLCSECAGHYENFKHYLEKASIPYRENKLLVRGLDYYTKTVFEIKSKDLGSQNTLCAGGRYDNLIAQSGGPQTPAVGVSIGVERLIILLRDSGSLRIPEFRELDLFVAALGDLARDRIWPEIFQMRKKDISVEIDFSKDNLKKLIKLSDRLNARFTLIVGENELSSGKGILRNMKTKKQHSVDLNALCEEIRKHI